MSRSVAEAATGTVEIASNIIGLAQAAETTTDGVQQRQQAAGQLAQMSGDLKTLVATYRT